MPITVRGAIPSDGAAIAGLNAHVQGIHAAAHPWRFKAPSASPDTAAAFKTMLSAPNRFAFLADVEGVPAGYVIGEIIHRAETIFHHANALVHVEHIAVRTNARRRGVGRALLDAAKAHGASQGVTLLELEVWAFSDDARGFFKRYGLVSARERMWNRIEPQ